MPRQHFFITASPDHVTPSTIDRAIASALDPASLVNLVAEQMRMALAFASQAEFVLLHTDGNMEALFHLRGYLMEGQRALDYDLTLAAMHLTPKEHVS